MLQRKTTFYVKANVFLCSFEGCRALHPQQALPPIIFATQLNGTHNICTPLTLLGTIFTCLFLSFHVQSQLPLKFVWYWRKILKHNKKKPYFYRRRVGYHWSHVPAGARVGCTPPPELQCFLVINFSTKLTADFIQNSFIDHLIRKFQMAQK